MSRFLSKSLLSVFVIMFCFIPLLVFCGCDNETVADVSINENGTIEITDVEKVSIRTENGFNTIYGYQPYENKIWYNEKTQMICFFVYEEYVVFSTKTTQLTRYDFPREQCAIVYKTKETKTDIEQN